MPEPALSDQTRLAEDITAENVRMQPQDCAIRLIWSLSESFLSCDWAEIDISTQLSTMRSTIIT